MAVLYSRIFVAIRRRSKLEIWKNAVVVSGGSRVSSNASCNAGTSRKSFDSKQQEDGDEDADEEAASCRSQSGDDVKPELHLLDHEAASQQQSSDRILSPRNSPDAQPEDREGSSSPLDTGEVENAPASTLDTRQSTSLDGGRHKCVRFLLVTQGESDSNDVDDLELIEMRPVEQNNYDDVISDDQRSDAGRLPARLMERLRQRIPKRRRYGDRQRQNSLSSDVKAAKQLGVIMGAFCVCFLPYFVCFVVVAVCHQCVDDQLMTTVTWIGYVNSTLNPFLYPLCNRQFRISFRRMFSNVRNFGAATSSVAVSLRM